MLVGLMIVLLIFDANNVAIFIVIIVLFLREDHEQKVDINEYHKVFLRRVMCVKIGSCALEVTISDIIQYLVTLQGIS